MISLRVLSIVLSLCFPHIHPRHLGRICWRHTSNRPFTWDQVSYDILWLYVTYSCINICRNLLSLHTSYPQQKAFQHWTHHFHPFLPSLNSSFSPSPTITTSKHQDVLCRDGRHGGREVDVDVGIPRHQAGHLRKTARKKPCFCGIAAKKGFMEDVIEHHVIYAVCSMLSSVFHFAGTPMRHHAPWTKTNCRLRELSGNTLVLLHQRGQTVLCKGQSKWLPALSWRHLQRKGACHRKISQVHAWVMLPLQNSTSCPTLNSDMDTFRFNSFCCGHSNSYISGKSWASMPPIASNHFEISQGCSLQPCSKEWIQLVHPIWLEVLDLRTGSNQQKCSSA